MPLVRYSDPEVKRLTESILKFFDPDASITPEEKIKAESHWFLKEWTISEDIPSGHIDEIYKRKKGIGSRFLRALNKARDIVEVRLARLMVSEPKRAIPIIFALKNTAGWRDFPEESKDQGKKRLVLELHLPTKLAALPAGVMPQRLSAPDKVQDANYVLVSPKGHVRKLGLPENNKENRGKKEGKQGRTGERKSGRVPIDIDIPID